MTKPYIKLSTLQFPLYEGDIRLEHPEITEDQTGDTFPILPDYASVEVTNYPPHDIFTQIIVPLPPEQINGIWKTMWAVRDLTIEERQQMEANSLDDINITVERL